eukprot:CAMPEP_0115618840 /NCGR_PEP_ID=MMETSP0272-20121206/24369_1 /TAXON_ID=71861 /ORGANISM="Scrippsiella trochoidea, Strain CCMP3099" /LENGTH=130 /DNA_ID=CAMNT_0003054843 /DNA_START=388 /DNA_END=778 /DNA_ORIENTATION=+
MASMCAAWSQSSSLSDSLPRRHGLILKVQLPHEDATETGYAVADAPGPARQTLGNHGACQDGQGLWQPGHVLTEEQRQEAQCVAEGKSWICGDEAVLKANALPSTMMRLLPRQGLHRVNALEIGMPGNLV